LPLLTKDQFRSALGINKNLIVTLAIGDTHRERWNSLCAQNWRAYGAKHGYDILCIDQPLDRSERAQRRSPSWQKCLILSQDLAYERIVWLDADILINNAAAPSIIESVPPSMVGAVDEFSLPAPSLSRIARERMIEFWTARGEPFLDERTPAAYHANYGFDAIHLERVVQGGTLVLSPCHRAVLEKIYYSYEDRGEPYWHYEMRPLSFELQNANCVHWLDGRFNALWNFMLFSYYPFLMSEPPKFDPSKRLAARLFRRLYGKNPEQFAKQIYKETLRASVNRAFHSTYFMHFAGRWDHMALVNPDSNT